MTNTKYKIDVLNEAKKEKARKERAALEEDDEY